MITGINHITLSVRSLEHSFSFYKDVLGLIPIMKSSYSAYFEAGNDWIAIIEDSNARETALPEYTHIAFSIPIESFDKSVKALQDSNVTVWQDNESEGDSFYFLDPDGHKLELHTSDLKSRLKARKQSEDPSIIFFGAP